MQFITLAALFGTAFAVGGLEARGTKSLCSSVDSCVATAGNFDNASAFCASYNAQVTVAPSACPNAKREAAPAPAAAAVTPLVLAPQKPRCFKKFLDGHLSKACSCVVEPTTTLSC